MNNDTNFTSAESPESNYSLNRYWVLFVVSALYTSLILYMGSLAYSALGSVGILLVMLVGVVLNPVTATWLAYIHIMKSRAQNATGPTINGMLIALNILVFAADIVLFALQGSLGFDILDFAGLGMLPLFVLITDVVMYFGRNKRNA